MVNKSLSLRKEDRLLRPARRLWDVFDLRSDFDRMFDDLFDFTLANVPLRRSNYPPIDMTETDTEFVLKAELPGIDPKNIDINVTADRIEIRGEVKDEWSRKIPVVALWNDMRKFRKSYRFTNRSRSRWS